MLRSYIIVFVIIIAFGVWMFPAFKTGANIKATNKQSVTAKQQEKYMSVDVIKVMAEDIEETISINGQTVASKIVDIKARTQGKIVKIYKSKGNNVSKGDIIAKIDIADRNSKLTQAKSILTQRQSEYEVAKGLKDKGFSSKVKLTAAKAALETAKANLDSIKLDISYTNIKAPFDGILENSNIEVGSYVKKGDMVAKIIDINPIDVSIFIPEKDIDKITSKNSAIVELSNGLKFKAMVNYISKFANERTRTFRVDVRIENTKNKIPSGMTAKVIFDIANQKAHRLPLSSLTLSDSGIVGVKIAKNIDDKGRGAAKFIPVKIVKETGDYIWVQGLNDGDLVVITGQDFIADSSKIMINFN